MRGLVYQSVPVISQCHCLLSGDSSMLEIAVVKLQLQCSTIQLFKGASNYETIHKGITYEL